jgi:hypothetical protein
MTKPTQLLLWLSLGALIFACSFAHVLGVNDRNHQLIAFDNGSWNATLDAHPVIAEAIQTVTGKPPLRSMPGYFQSFRWYNNDFYYLPCHLTGKMMRGDEYSGTGGILIAPGMYTCTAAGTEESTAKINAIIIAKTGWATTVGATTLNTP